MHGAIELGKSRSGFHRALEQLQDQVLVLGAMVEHALNRSIDALCARDVASATGVQAEMVFIKHKRFEIEEAVLLQMATQQPMASDLRRLAAMLHIVTDLQRMGEYAAHIAETCVEIGDTPHVKPLIDIPLMTERAVSMLRRALGSFVERDDAAAEAISAEDDDVDVLYQQVYRELLAIMLADPRTIGQATQLLRVAHNLERVADRVQNICGRVVFVVTGSMHERPRHAYH